MNLKQIIYKIIWKIRKTIADILRKKVVWSDPLGWHSLQYKGVPIIEEPNIPANEIWFIDDFYGKTRV